MTKSPSKSKGKELRNIETNLADTNEKAKDLKSLTTPRKVTLSCEADLYFHTQAAEDISDLLQNNKFYSTKFAKRFFEAIHEGQITAYDHRDGFEIEIPIPLQRPLCVKVDEVNLWLKKNSFEVHWNPENLPTINKTKLNARTTEQRQAERWRLCEEMGLIMPTNTYGPYPRGISKVAEKLGIKRQTLTADLNAYREREMHK